MKKILASLILIILLILGSVTYLFFNPEIILSPKVLTELNQKYLPALEMEWEKVNIDFTRQSLTTKTLSLSGRDFCAKYEGSIFCFEKLSLMMRLNLLKIWDFDIRELKVKDKKIVILANTDKEPKKEPADKIDMNELLSPIYQIVNQNLKYIPKSYQVTLAHTVLKTGDDDLSINTQIDSKEMILSLKSIKTKKIKITSHLRKNEKDQDSYYQGPLDIHLPGLNLKSKVKISLKEKLSIQLSSTLSFKEGPLQNLKLKNPILSALEVDEEKINIVFSNVNLSLPQYISQLSFKKCDIQLEFNSEDILFNCPRIQINPATTQLSNKNIPQLKKDLTFNLNLDGQFKSQLESLESTNLQKLGKINIKLDHKKIKFLDLDFNSTLAFYIKKNSFTVKPESIDWNLEINEFSSIVETLKDTSWAVISPFHSLKGRIRLYSTNRGEITEEKAFIPFELDLNLDKAQHNQIKSTTKGSLNLPFKSGPPQLKLDIDISKFYVYLPELDPIKGLPKISSDNRVSKKVENPKESQNSESSQSENTLDYQVTIKTRNANSIRIYYYLFSPYLPLGLQANLTPEEVTYSVDIKNRTKVEYLKRVIYISSLSLSNKNTPPLDLKLNYEASGYDILLNIVGTLDDPKLLLSSTPSLPREDIISLLIYNRKSSEISSFEKENVGGTEAAIVDRALGLFSIWAFASTPIDSVSYDPSTKTYSAQISLPGGVNFSIGTDWDRVSILSFRKRLNDSWSIVTSYLPATQDQDSKENILLQKEISF
tara:strand:- start:157790 stop:160093 length:2304 start_codon:yes stop_codon:yes gene_type:complete